MQDSTFKYRGFNPTVSALENKQLLIVVYIKCLCTNKVCICVQVRYIPSNAHKCVSYVVFHGVKSAEDRVKLIQLPRGSLERLSKALGVDRVGIFGLTKDT